MAYQNKLYKMMCYPWLNFIYNKILNSYRIGQGHHALIIDSKWDNGEDILINMIVRWLICSNPDESTFCNTCNDCRLMNSKTHPNYFVLDLNKNAQSVGVDMVKNCIDYIHNSTRYSKVQIIFIKYVEYLTDQAINVLLKILEEPPVNTYFFLKTRKYLTLPKTLLSRCIRWCVVPPKESLGLDWLTQRHNTIDRLSIQTALRICHISPIEANLMLKSNDWKKRISLCDSIYQAIIDKNFLKILPFLNIHSQYNIISIYWLITLLMDSIKYKFEIKEKFLINLDQLKLIAIISKNWNLISLSNQLQQWLILFQYFQKFDNINRELLLTYRLLNWN